MWHWLKRRFVPGYADAEDLRRAWHDFALQLDIVEVLGGRIDGAEFMRRRHG